MVGLLIDDGNERNNGEGSRSVSGSLCGDDRSTSAAFASEQVGASSKVGTGLSIRMKPAERACEK